MRAIATILSTILLLAAIPRAHAVDLRHFDDATLRSVQFVDANRGWAVGDDGVVWHSQDGGKKWQRQATGLRASLRSVHFLLPYQGIGWIAGREELPGGGSVGVLLFTRDGGKSWERQLPNALPGLNQVRFIDLQTGFLLGDGSDQFSSGVFKTTDAGRSWEPVKGPRTSSWLAGDYQDAHTGVLAGAWSRLASFRKDAFGTAQVDPLDGRSILGLQVLPKSILAVGQGGLILSSKSAGERWGFVDTKLPREVLSNLDFHAIHGVDQNVWIVGRPGSIVLASDDQGVTWKLHKTGQSLPMHGLHFFDAQNGWAVGDAGTILATVDGGRSWTVQRQASKRAAAMFVHANPEQFHVDTLARIGAEQGYLATALRCIAPAAASSAWPQSVVPQRFAAGVRQAGGLTGETLWQFPLPQYLAESDKQLIIDHWNQLHGGEVDRQLLRQLVLAVRIWRPSVVIGDPKNAPMAGNPAAALIGEALQKALLQASDRQAFPEQIDQLGLEPWRPTRFYTGWEKKSAQIILDANEISARLENSYRDFARSSLRILCNNPGPYPAERGYRLAASAPDASTGQRQLMEGLNVAVSDARRNLPAETELSPERLKAMQARRNLILLADKLTNPSLLLTQIAPVLETMPDDDGAATVLAVAESFVRQGQWLLAREAYMLMVEKYPTQPLSAEACRWLIRHGSSSEARRRHELGQFLLQTNSSFALKKPPQPTDKKPNGPPGQDVVAQASLTYLANANEARQWYRGSLEMGKRLGGLGSLYAADPAIQFCLQSSRRQLGEGDQVRDWHGKFVEYSPRGPWHDAASTELWLMGKGASPGKRLTACKKADKKPLLDGNFDDACWQNNGPLVLENAVGDTGKQCPTRAWFAHDQEYLYIALRCQHPPGMQVEPVKNRTRDAQLDAFDRVSILLDLDRDYATCFHLQIDQRGCVREDCWGDVSWNPKWYVAVKSTADCWFIEAAMPLGELTGEPITAASAWACNVVRILPGRGVQAWSLPADVQPRPEGMGVMTFR